VAEASEVVFTSLPGPTEFEQVAMHPDTGILAGLNNESVYIDTTTNSPTVFRQVAAEFKARGFDILDAPVSGRPPRMTVMVGGDQDVYQKHLALFEAIAQNVFYVGETGTACAAKLVTQYLGYCNYVTALEGLLIGAKAGIDLEVLAQIVPVSAGASRQFDGIPDGVFTGEFKSGGTVDIIAKDLHLACELARDVQAPARIGLIADDVFQRTQALGLGQTGFHAAVQVLEQMAGAQLRTGRAKQS
jgi:3-hydroxyisobutyrate dehydrogenase-like beta-hydroxyacid dehydrogenase